MLTGHSKAIIAVNSVLPFLAVLAVALRLYARRLRHLALISSDYTILVALALTLANSMPYIYCATNGGMGKHIDTLGAAELVVFGKVTFWTQYPYIFAVSLIKISILLFYRSIFVTQRFRLATNVLGGVVLLWTIAFFFASVFQAWPISRNWNPEEPGTMINEFAMYLALACTELVLDVMILTLPWTVIWGLHMKTNRKWLVSGVFTLGGFVCVSSAFRIYYFHTTHTSASEDFTYDTYNIFIWTVIEPCMGVICACLPILGPVFQGGHSPESLIGSIRSYISVRTQNSNRSKGSIWEIRAHDTSKQSGNSSAKSFHKMPDDAIILTSVHGRQLDDAESQDLPAEGIFVQTKVSTNDDDRK